MKFSDAIDQMLAKFYNRKVPYCVGIPKFESYHPLHQNEMLFFRELVIHASCRG